MLTTFTIWAALVGGLFHRVRFRSISNISRLFQSDFVKHMGSAAGL